jgi:hypothetical protein
LEVGAVLVFFLFRLLFWTETSTYVQAMEPENSVAKSVNTGSHGLRGAQDVCILGFFAATRQPHTVLVHRISQLALQVR